MMRKWFMLLMFVSCMALFAACTDDQEGNENVSESDKSELAIETNVHTPEPDKQPDFPDEANTLATVEEDGEELGEESDEQQLPEVFQQYVADSIPMNDDESVVAFVTGDIDLDGYEEAVIAISSISRDFHKVYLLKNRDGTVTSVQDGIVDTLYSIYELKLVELEDRANPVIYLGATNHGPMTGFQLSEYLDGELKTLAYSASAVGAGSDSLIDENGDGRYDGYVQERWSYDVYDYWTNRYFKLEQGEFILDRVEIYLPDYPDEPKDVVVEYVSLTLLNEADSPELNERLTALCPSCSEVDGSDLPQGISYWLRFTDDLDVSIGADDQTAQVSLPIHEDSASGGMMQFQLYQEESQWKIHSYEIIDG